MELNLKLISLPSAFSPAPAPPSAAKATPHGRVAAADDTGTSSSGSATAPSGLTAALAIATIIDGDYDSGDDFHCDGDEFGAEYTPKLTNGALYSPSCSLSVAASLSSMPAAQSSSPSRPPWVSPALLKLLSTLSVSLIKVPLPDGRFAVADMGATDHMLPDKLCFISYRTVSGLSVCMGNNSFVPVLGPGTAVFELNGKRLLVRNVLHVPGLAVPSTVFESTSPSVDAALSGLRSPASLCISQSSSFLWTRPSTAICRSLCLGALPHSTLSTTSNRDVLRSFTHLRSLQRCLMPHRPCFLYLSRMMFLQLRRWRYQFLPRRHACLPRQLSTLRRSWPLRLTFLRSPLDFGLCRTRCTASLTLPLLPCRPCLYRLRWRLLPWITSVVILMPPPPAFS